MVKALLTRLFRHQLAHGNAAKSTSESPVILKKPLNPPFKLNVGGGKKHPHLPDWYIVDLRPSADVRMDFTEHPLPFEDNAVDIVFCSHTLEHILPLKLGYVLDEFYRVLKPDSDGGLLRIAVPDIAQACKAYVDNDIDWFKKADITYADPEAPLGGLLASWFYSMSDSGNGHVHCFDFEYMAYWLRKHGFTGIRQSTYQGSQREELRGEAFDRRPESSLYVEAVKPG